VIDFIFRLKKKNPFDNKLLSMPKFRHPWHVHLH
jgi:hypothetical protein